MGGILSTYTKMSRGGFVRGGLCPYPRLSISVATLSYSVPRLSISVAR